MSKKKNTAPRFHTRREGVAFRQHDFAQLRNAAEKAVVLLQKRNPEGAKQFAESPEKLGEITPALMSTPEWDNVRLDPRVIANHLAAHPLPKEQDKEKADQAIADYVADCLDEIIDDGARMALVTLALSALVSLVRDEQDELAWADLVTLNLLTSQEVKPRSIPLLHNLFWLNYADYVFQRNVMAFVSRALDPDMPLSDSYRAALEADWDTDEVNREPLAAALGVKAGELPAKAAETARLVILSPTVGDLAPTGELVEQTADHLSSQAVELIRAAQDNDSGREELDAAAAGLVRQMAVGAVNALRSAEYLDRIKAVLEEVAASTAGALPVELAQRALILLGLLPAGLNPLFDALLLEGVRRKAASDYHDSEVKEEEPTAVPENVTDTAATDDAPAPTEETPDA